MSRLTKWVESLERNVKIRKAANTKSLYYTVQNTVIRISDHFSISKGWDIQIIIPLNNTKTYLLGISEGSDVLTFTFSELKTFIQNYLYINRIKSSKENIDKSKDTTSFDLNNPKERITNCSTTLTFNDNDVQILNRGGWEEYIIKCPKCGNHLELYNRNGVWK